MRFSTLACSAAISVALVGCESDDDMATLAPAPAETDVVTIESKAATTTAPITEVASASPEAVGKSWKTQMLAEAMAGLHYDTGRVTIDETYAASIPNRGDAAVSDALQQQGHRYFFEQNRQLEALRSLGDAIIIDPTNAAAYADLGAILAGRGDLVKAEAAYRSALDLDASHMSALTGMAVVHQMNGDMNAANDTWMQILELDPQHGTAHARLAVGRYYEGAYAAAWTHYYAALDFGGEVPTQLAGLLARHMPDPRP